MAEPLTPSGVFLRNGLLALGFDEASANEQIIAIETEALDAARAAAPTCHEDGSPCDICAALTDDARRG